MARHGFNPRTHEGCDAQSDGSQLIFFLFQSTHPRGVRHANPGGSGGGDGVSIHAPTRGATYKFAADSEVGKFQSTHPRGVRQAFVADVPEDLWFQSTHPRGVRPTGKLLQVLHQTFQSTHPRGVRLTTTTMLQSAKCFNPRTHEGCDTLTLAAVVAVTEFQSTHPRGVRLFCQI